MSDWMIYVVPPIDEGWCIFSSVAESIRRAPDYETSNRLSADWEHVKALATATEWDGEFAGAPVVFWLPVDEGFQHGFAWKGGSNGTCFIASRVRMDWLGVEPF